MPALRLAVFADGCYWHCCPVHRRIPEDNRAYWVQKLARNRRRDRAVSEQLRAAGYSVVRIWEHDLKRLDLRLSARLRRAGTMSLKRRIAREAADRRLRSGRGARPGTPG